MRASSKRPRVESSSGVAPPPRPSSGDLAANAFVIRLLLLLFHLLVWMFLTFVVRWTLS